MLERPTILERAFELARTGEFSAANKVKLQLKAEQYAGVKEQITGQTLMKQLTATCREARAARGRATDQ